VSHREKPFRARPLPRRLRQRRKAKRSGWDTGFRIRRATLSPECRRNIELLFKKKRMNVDMAGLVKEVESEARDFLKDWEAKTRILPPPLSAKYIRQQVRALEKTLQGLTFWARGDLYNIFEWNPRTKIEQWYRKNERDGLIPVNLAEVIARVQQACELFEKHYSPNRGAPTDVDRVLFAMSMKDIYEHYTRRKATSTPSAAFDLFLSYVLADVADEPVSTSPRKLIESIEVWRQRFGCGNTRAHRQHVESLARHTPRRTKVTPK